MQRILQSFPFVESRHEPGRFFLNLRKNGLGSSIKLQMTMKGKIKVLDMVMHKINGLPNSFAVPFEFDNEQEATAKINEIIQQSNSHFNR